MNRNWNNDNSFIFFFFFFCFLGKSQHSYSGRRSEQPSQSEGDLADDALSGHEEKIPGGPGLNERELWSLHRAVPGLRRHDPRTSTIRQHYYPEVYINCVRYNCNLTLTHSARTHSRTEYQNSFFFHRFHLFFYLIRAEKNQINNFSADQGKITNNYSNSLPRCPVCVLIRRKAA